MTVKPLDPAESRVIGRYRVLGLLGSGGMGRVLLGIGPDGRFVAIKQIHQHLLGEHEYRARFRREVSASTRVSGAFTAPVVDFDVDSGNPWLASLFVVGLPLDKVVSEYGPLPVSAVKALAAGLAVALQDIHRLGLVHRDLKPANVMLTAEGPRVIDFGIAQLHENPSGLTETGSALGSPAYMSPEQASAEPITPASDVFSLGALLAMAATGQSPFAAPSMAYTLFNIVHTEPDLGQMAPELRYLIAPLLAKKPELRPTPSQLLDQIGWLPDGAAPWPAPVHAEIQRQFAALTALTANPDATVIVSGTGYQTAAIGTGFGLADVPGSDKAKSRRRTARRVGLAALAVLLLVAGAITWIRLSDKPAGPSAADSMLTKLRNADACLWLQQSMRSSVPPDSGWPSDVSTWTTDTYLGWECAASTAGQSLQVKPGATTDVLQGTGRSIDGVPILSYGGDGSFDCERGVDLSGSNQKWGIVVSMYKSANCDLAEKVLTRLVATRNAPPQRSDAVSLGRIDPCGLVSDKRLNDTVGPVAAKPTDVSAHTCHWHGTSEVKLQLNFEKANEVSTNAPIDLGNGITAIPHNHVVNTICALEYPYRSVGDKVELVSLELQSGGDGDDALYQTICTATKSIMQEIVGNLPRK
ncbi:serine/threonine protein kinase [Nocardia yunnanensis]|uniref:Serine/threonine protein kinase n=1 Tax=Nocardia yunnanensis TaxID=2382165 RepID=A0A386ZJ24_9NOCA|nr:serine/threonine-protein kinase [Nocardia yunnanensis]AYF76599.1 serine/threonine protein kinase [Nocardia yunnanensis]